MFTNGERPLSISGCINTDQGPYCFLEGRAGAGLTAEIVTERLSVGGVSGLICQEMLISPAAFR